MVLDALGYGEIGTFVFTGEWLPAPDVEYGHSLGRYPDGDDTDNNEADFNDYDTLTPGEPNPAVGIQEYETISEVLPIPKFPNPIRHGTILCSVIKDVKYYPIKIYNARGQIVEDVTAPEHGLVLPTGIYFVELQNTEKGCAKIVILK